MATSLLASAAPRAPRCASDFLSGLLGAAQVNDDLDLRPRGGTAPATSGGLIYLPLGVRPGLAPLPSPAHLVSTAGGAAPAAARQGPLVAVGRALHNPVQEIVRFAGPVFAVDDGPVVDGTSFVVALWEPPGSDPLLTLMEATAEGCVDDCLAVLDEKPVPEAVDVRVHSTGDDTCVAVITAGERPMLRSYAVGGSAAAGCDTAGREAAPPQGAAQAPGLWHVADASLDGRPHDLELAGDFLYVSQTAGDRWLLTVFEHAAQEPAPVPVAQLSARARDPALRRLIDVAGGPGGARLLAVGDGEVLEVDVSDPLEPTVTGVVAPATPCLESVYDVALDGPARVAVLGHGCLERRVLLQGLWEIDRSATHDRAYDYPSRGRPFVQTSDFGSSLVQAHGAAGGASSWNPDDPWELDLPGHGSCLREHVGHLIGLAGDALWVFEPVGDRLQPHSRSRVGFSSPTRCEVATAGTTAWISADDLLAEIDLSNLSRPQFEGTSRVFGTRGALAVDEARAYIAAEEAGLVVRPHDTPGEAGLMRTAGSAYDAAYHDGALYVADGPAGVTSFDTTVEGLPRRVVNLPLHMDARALVWSDGRLYVTLVRSADSHRWWLGDFAVAALSATSPEKLELLGYLDLQGTAPGRPAVGADGVLVPAGDRLHVVDFSRPTHPRVVRTLHEAVRDAAFAGEVEAAALGPSGVGVIAPP